MHAAPDPEAGSGAPGKAPLERYNWSKIGLGNEEPASIAPGKGGNMNLTEEPEIVDWPETHYVFVEKAGPFMKTAPEAWSLAHSFVAALSERNKITGYMSLYKMGPNTYRAGFALAAGPVDLPAGLEYERFGGGRYSRFVLTGPYSDLPQATGRVFEIAAKSNLKLRSDYCIEHYVSDPGVTPKETLITEILIPTAE
jgi:effector-binding domain-containing protein